MLPAPSPRPSNITTLFEGLLPLSFDPSSLLSSIHPCSPARCIIVLVTRTSSPARTSILQLSIVAFVTPLSYYHQSLSSPSSIATSHDQEIVNLLCHACICPSTCPDQLSRFSFCLFLRIIYHVTSQLCTSLVSIPCNSRVLRMAFLFTAMLVVDTFIPLSCLSTVWVFLWVSEKQNCVWKPCRIA